MKCGASNYCLEPRVLNKNAKQNNRHGPLQKLEEGQCAIGLLAFSTERSNSRLVVFVLIGKA